MGTKGELISEVDEVLAECGVMVHTGVGLVIVRVSPKQRFTGLRFDTWIDLAKSAPLTIPVEEKQMYL